MYDIGSSIGFNSGLHRPVDEIRPDLPIALVAGALHTKQKTARNPVKLRAFEQVFCFAIAKLDSGIEVHVLLRRHANRP